MNRKKKIYTKKTHTHTPTHIKLIVNEILNFESIRDKTLEKNTDYMRDSSKKRVTWLDLNEKKSNKKKSIYK